MGWEKNRDIKTFRGEKIEENVKSTPEIWTQTPEFIGGKWPRTERNMVCANMRP